MAKKKTKPTTNNHMYIKSATACMSCYDYPFKINAILELPHLKYGAAAGLTSNPLSSIESFTYSFN